MLRRLVLILGVAAALLFAGVVGPAAAQTCGHWVTDTNGKVTYVTFDCTGGSDAEPAGGGGEAAACYLGRQDKLSYQVGFCSGALSCYRYLPPPSAPNPADWPARPAGVAETATYANQACFTQPPAEELASNEYIWVTPDEVDIGAQVDAAYGQLAAPAFTLTFNPPGRGIVNLPTWYWAAGPTGATLTGSSAGGLVAIAEPDHLEVDPGDGSGAFECPWAVAQGDACSYTYGRSSAGEDATVAGDPAYAGRMRLVFSVRFEFNAAPFVIAGLPTTLTTAWQTTLIPVAEIQALVGRP